MTVRYLVEMEGDPEPIRQVLLGLGGVVSVTPVDREFGRSYRGMKTDILSTGSLKPFRGQEQYIRYVSGWRAINDQDWKELGSERKPDD